MKKSEWVKKRKDICRVCPIKTKIDRVWVCGKLLKLGANGELKKGCGCILPIKVRLAGSACPEGKWGPEGSSVKYRNAVDSPSEIQD